jgi:integrase
VSEGFHGTPEEMSALNSIRRRDGNEPPARIEEFSMDFPLRKNHRKHKDEFRKSAAGNKRMLGEIYSDQRCDICKELFVHDGKTGLYCENHPEKKATEKFRVVFPLSSKLQKRTSALGIPAEKKPKLITRRFKSYEDAGEFLSYVRTLYRQGTLDPRDYAKDRPLSVGKLLEHFLSLKDPRKPEANEDRKAALFSRRLDVRSRNAIRKVKWSTYRNLQGYAKRFTDYFGDDANIKTITAGDIEECLACQDTLETKRYPERRPLSSKTLHNMCSFLHDFYEWLRFRGVFTANDLPEMPVVSVLLGWRRTIDKATQKSVVDKVYDLTKNYNLKIWFGIKLLCTYIKIRPGELREALEIDFNLEAGGILIRKSKEENEKFVKFIDEDIELTKHFLSNDSNVDTTLLYFFRHLPGTKGAPENHQFSKNIFYDWWRRACNELNVHGVSLYPGTKHSSARALKKNHTPEEIRRKATGHKSNKAFDRYFGEEYDQEYEIFLETSPGMPGKEMVKDFRVSKRSKLLKFKE